MTALWIIPEQNQWMDIRTHGIATSSRNSLRQMIKLSLEQVVERFRNVVGIRYGRDHPSSKRNASDNDFLKPVGIFIASGGCYEPRNRNSANGFSKPAK